ncbi:protein 60A [Toxorhynchites rutilus septentrionalis]|uniref:protein 60A n=1 Tax=Toxorhynchites rutilus septentrionalis TaxID=329112 RepID=UPI002478E391|nr:protein 60A [Toxorhynchites rutilus septentrionalis]XP_055633614.1 protein 60A [Toxorhynchites rutilus septentrionalis]XP_055633620.1 protein 60A [Toxorhynchites rutilus septentrionalis]
MHNAMDRIILFTLMASNIAFAFGGLSGFYVDNGVGQTVMDTVMTNDDQLEIEHEILELLGLPERPRKRRLHSSISKSAPQFLLNVYDKLSAETSILQPRHKRSIDNDEDIIFTEADNKAIDQSDIIMTFLNKNHHVSEVRHEKGRRLWFDVNDTEAELILAELRIYQRHEQNKYKNENDNITIAIYSITNYEGETELMKIAETSLGLGYDGWLEINVTSVVSQWIGNNQLNKGLYIGAYFKHNPGKEIKLDDIGLVNTKGDDKHQPFLVAYCKGSQTVKPIQHNHMRSKRNTQRKRKSKSENRNPLLEQTIDHHKSCQIKTLYVSFKDLNWQDWIIAPEGYGAFYCSGECNFPLNAHMNATNHAIVQTLVHLMHPTKVPKPCCAPTKLIPISVLYHIDEANVNLKKYKNMVVKSCGCH